MSASSQPRSSGSGARDHRQAGQRLKDDAAAGRVVPRRLDASSRAAWPAPLRQFWEARDAERFVLSGTGGDRLDYAVKRGGGLWVYSADSDGVRMEEISREIREARARAGDLRQRDLPRGFTLALLLSAGVVWTGSLLLLSYLSARLTRPIRAPHRGTRRTGGRPLRHAGRADRARRGRAGRPGLQPDRRELQQSRDRLVYLTQMASWQTLARKMAHEVKNSLTPIRLTVEEMLARSPRPTARSWSRLAASWWTRWRAWSGGSAPSPQFAAEPEPHPSRLDLEGLARGARRIPGHAHPGDPVPRRGCPAEPAPRLADPDLVKGILTNLLENAAQAAGPGARCWGWRPRLGGPPPSRCTTTGRA